MSTVLWANVLVEGVVTSPQEDLHALYRHTAKLDAIAKKLGLPAFSSMCDTTDVRYTMDESLELPAGMTTTTEAMAAEGDWLARNDAEELLERLLGHIATEQPRFGLLRDQRAEVVAELETALAFLRSQPQADRFNFAVVT